jgi:ribosomal protein L34E
MYGNTIVRTGPRCPDCNEIKDEILRIPIELVDKKTKEIIEVSYGEVICIECFNKRYKGRTKLRIYV